MARETGKNAGSERRRSLFSEGERDLSFGSTDTPQIFAPKETNAPGADDALDSAHTRFKASLRGRDEVSPYEEQRRARYALDPRSRTVIALAVVALLCYVVALVLPSNTFDVNNHNLSLAWFIQITGRNVSNITTMLTGGGAFGGIDFKACQYLIVALAGSALAVSGAAYQGSLKNQLASPSTLGVMSGAQLGSIIFIMLTPAIPLLSYTVADGSSGTLLDINQGAFGGLGPVEYFVVCCQRALFSLAGSAVVVGCVLGIAFISGRGRMSRAAMVVAGQLFAAVISSVVVVVRSYLQVYGTSYQITALSTTMQGDLSSVFTLVHLAAIGIPVVICLIVLIALRGKLNLLAFGEEEARSMGVRTSALRIILVACCTILTAVVVAFCGAVGYVGFLIPHLARRIVGPSFNYLVPASALLGAAFLTAVFFVFSSFTIPTGSISMVTTAIGVVLFVIVIFRQRRGGYASW